MENEQERKTESDETMSMNESAPLYLSSWCSSERFQAGRVETMDEMIAAVWITIRDLKKDLKLLKSMRDDGVTLGPADDFGLGFPLETDNPDVAKKYGFDEFC